MTKNDKEHEDLIGEILSRALGELSNWAPVKLMQGVGPQHPQIHNDFEKAIQAYRKNVRSLLADKSIAELRSEWLMVVGSVLHPLTKPDGVHFKLREELNYLKKTCPPWFASGWSEKEHLLEVNYWMAVETLSINEAALLLVGVDPRKANYDALFGAYGFDLRTDEVLYFLEDYFELLVRRFGDPDSGSVEINLGELCEWVMARGLVVSTQLNGIIKLRKPSGLEGNVKRTDHDRENPLHGSSRSMFQRALVAVAINHYSFKENRDSAKVAKAIVEAGDYIGFRLDEQNIAIHIRAGFAQISDDDKAEMREKHDEK
jgi:ribosomal 50S subunit-recycling heat shock protein